VSPTGAVLWSWGDGRPAALTELTVFGTIGTAFQTPTTTELANPAGPGFNPDVEPQTSVTYELGARARWQDWLRGDAAAYAIEIDDELVPFESDAGRTAFRNAGRSRRLGLELDWQAQVLAPLRWSSAVTLLQAEFRDYRVGDQSFAGNQEPGIPPWWIYQELLYQHDSGFFAALEAFLVDGYFVDDANDARTSAYQLLNLRAGYQHDFGPHWSVAPYLGLNNLLDQNYSGTVRLNALGGRYVEPAPGFNVYGGIAIIARL
jgi:iron complex outermembrane receptor protein